MNFAKSFTVSLRICLHRSSLCNYSKRYLCNNGSQVTELTVQTFCNVHIKIPFNLEIKPLNVLKYHNYDKLLISFPKHVRIQFSQNGAMVRIYSDSQCLDDDDDDETIICNVSAPIKANLNIEAAGNIFMGHFESNNVSLKSTKGHIIVDKYQGDNISFFTNNGDIKLNGVVQASSIEGRINGHGSITTDRLQGLKVNLQTKCGNISVKSSYCNESHFTVERGNLDLENIHKNSNVTIKDVGNLNITGFDGNLKAILQKGNADIQLSRIVDESSITIKETGQLILRLSDECQKNCSLKIQSKNVQIDEQIEMNTDRNVAKTIHVNCENNSVAIKAASWADMLKLKIKK